MQAGLNQGDSRGWIYASLLIALLLGVLFGPALVGRKGIDGASMLQFEDPVFGPAPITCALPGRGGIDRTPELYDQPWETQAWRQLRAGKLPLWQPYNAFGKPLLASSQALPFNPLKLVLWNGSTGAAQAWFLVLRLACAGIGSLVLARALGLSPLGGFLAAIAFTLNGNFIYHFEYSELGATVMLPWLTLVAERCCKTPGFRIAAIFGLLIGATGLMGHPEAALFVSSAAVLAVGIGAIGQPDTWRRVGLLATSIAIGAALAACTILPMAELVHHGDGYILNSNSPWQPAWGYSYATKARLLWDHFFTGMALDGYKFNAYVGLIALALAPLGLWRRALGRTVIALLGISAFGFAVGFPGQHLSILPFALHATYMAPLVSLAVGLLAGAGLERLVGNPRRLAPLVIGIVLALVAYRFFVIGGGLVGTRIFLVTAGVAMGTLAVMWWRPQRVLPWVLVAGAMFQLFWTARLANPMLPLFAYTETPVLHYLQGQSDQYRLAGELKALEPDSNVMYGLDSLESYEVFNVHRYVSYMDALNGYDCGDFQEIGLTNSFKPDLLSLANVKYLLVPDPQPKTGPLSSYPIRMRQGHLALRENPGAMPRAWVSYGADFVPDEDTAAKQLRATPKRWLTRVLLETPGGKAPAGWQDASSAIAPVRMLGRDAQDVSLEATLTHPGWLVLSDIYYPGWKAEVDGKPAQILPADVAFRAVYLTPGTHRVVFTYASRTVMLGFGFTLLALLVSLGLLFVKPVRSPQRQEPLADAA